MASFPRRRWCSILIVLSAVILISVVVFEDAAHPRQKYAVHLGSDSNQGDAQSIDTVKSISRNQLSVSSAAAAAADVSSNKTRIGPGHRKPQMEYEDHPETDTMKKGAMNKANNGMVPQEENKSLHVSDRTSSPVKGQSVDLDSPHNGSPRSDQPILTLFTTFRYSAGKAHIHRNSMQMLSLLAPHVKLLLYTDGNEQLLPYQFGQSLGWDLNPVPVTSADGYPILRHMFLDAQSKYNTPFYGYVNADILLDQGVITTLRGIYSNATAAQKFLLVGRRWNYEMPADQRLHSLDDVNMAGQQGELFRSDAIDYFITTKDGFPWREIPDFMIGRVGYDNWLVATAVTQGMCIVDATETVLAVHQTGPDGNYAGHVREREIEETPAPTNLDLAGHWFNYKFGHTTCAPYETRFFYDRVFLHRRFFNSCYVLYYGKRLGLLVLAVCVYWFFYSARAEFLRTKVRSYVSSGSPVLNRVRLWRER